MAIEEIPPLLSEIEELRKGYGHKARLLKSLRRKSPPSAESVRNMMAAVSGANKQLMDCPYSKEEFYLSINNRRAAERLWSLWQEMLSCAEEENRIIDGRQSPPELIEAVARDIAAFRKFYRDFLALKKAPLAVKIIGIGEITTTIELVQAAERRVWNRAAKRSFSRAIKKMPLFPSRESAKNYIALFDEYHYIIRDKLGLAVPAWGSWLAPAEGGKFVVYNWQERLPQESVAALVIHKVSDDEVKLLFRMTLGELVKVFRHNRSQPDTLIGFDGQIPNWSVSGFDTKSPQITGDERLVYFDTSTPLMRRRLKEGGEARSPEEGEARLEGRGLADYGKDLLDTELFLKSVPSIIRPFIRAFLLQEILGRYYDPRKVVMDLIASFYLYRRPDMVPALVEIANEFMAREMKEFALEPFTVGEMTKYHKTDTMIWVFFRAVKRFDRWLTENVFGKKYPQRLPKRKFTPGPFGE